MRTDEFDYLLPPDLIAQTPTARGQSRLLVLNRASGALCHRSFMELDQLIRPGDTVVLNDTRVTARRLAARRSDGRPAEVLLLRPVESAEWEVLVRPARPFRLGAPVSLLVHEDDWVEATVTGITASGGRILRIADLAACDRLGSAGTAPLPPYIRVPLQDEERYQTVYSRAGGSAAAPTAGLHFTQEMLDKLRVAGADLAWVTLHVDVDTFRPVRTSAAEDHPMHGEWWSIEPEAARLINETRGRILAVGTTTVRALESAAINRRAVAAGCGVTRLFIRPGYEFQVVDGLLTNFHLPRSTLLMLVSAFAGRDAVLAAYRAAVAGSYRFYSFGDAMLIV